MTRVFRFRLGLIGLPLFLLTTTLFAQTPAAPTAILNDIQIEGLKTLSPEHVIAMSQLAKNSQVGKADLQAAADRLLQTGMFSKVNYSYKTASETLSVTFKLEESPRVPVYFDNFPWFADSELGDAIRKKIPYFDGTLPTGGSAVDQAAEAVKDLLASRKLNVTLTHQLLAAPLGAGDVQDFHTDGATFHIGSVEFGDPSLANNHTVQQQLGAVQGKPFSRMTIDLFLAEQLRPLYLQQGYLRVKLGPPAVRLTGNPNQKLPEDLPIFVPIVTAGIYHWKGPNISGNSRLSETTLANDFVLKPGDVANGMQIEAGLDHMREDYGHYGYLDAKIVGVPAYDDQTHTVSYSVTISEGPQYHFGQMILTGLSVNGESRLRRAWTIEPGSIFDKTSFEQLLAKLETHPPDVFGDLPLHYDHVGHWLRTDPAKHVVDVLLDFQ